MLELVFEGQAGDIGLDALLFKDPVGPMLGMDTSSDSGGDTNSEGSGTVDADSDGSVDDSDGGDVGNEGGEVSGSGGGAVGGLTLGWLLLFALRYKTPRRWHDCRPQPGTLTLKNQTGAYSNDVENRPADGK
jgi:hypothetical protein